MELCDTRFEIFKSYIVIVAKPYSSSHIRIVDENANMLSPILNVQESGHLNLESAGVTLSNRVIFFEPFVDSKEHAKDLDTSPEEDNAAPDTKVLLVPRTISIEQVMQTVVDAKSDVQGSRAFPIIPRSVSVVANPHRAIRDVHYHVPSGHPKDAIIVRDGYHYYHYNVDGYEDAGWGCAYRVIQTMISWFLDVIGDIPRIEEMQRILKRIDFAHATIEIGSKQWIGCIEASEILGEVSDGRISCRILHAQNLDDLESIIFNEIRNHLVDVGSPVMIGAGNYAFTIIGVSSETKKF
jgi:hypothetical protein